MLSRRRWETIASFTAHWRWLTDYSYARNSLGSGVLDLCGVCVGFPRAKASEPIWNGPDRYIGTVGAASATRRFTFRFACHARKRGVTVGFHSSRDHGARRE